MCCKFYYLYWAQNNLNSTVGAVHIKLIIRLIENKAEAH